MRKDDELFERFTNSLELDENLSKRIWNKGYNSVYRKLIRLCVVSNLKLPIKFCSSLEYMFEYCSLDEFKTFCHYYKNYKLDKFDISVLIEELYRRGGDSDKEKCKFLLENTIEEESINMFIKKNNIEPILIIHHKCEADPYIMSKSMGNFVDDEMYKIIKKAYKSNKGILQYLVDTYNCMFPNSVCYTGDSIAFNKLYYAITSKQFKPLISTDFMFLELNKQNITYTLDHNSDGEIILKDVKGNLYELTSEDLFPQKNLLTSIRNMKTRKSATN